MKLFAPKKRKPAPRSRMGSQNAAPWKRLFTSTLGTAWKTGLGIRKASSSRSGLYAWGAVAAAALCGWGAWSAYRDGNFLTVTRIEVTGNRHWETSRLLEYAGLEVGQRLLEAPLSAGRRNLLRLPGVKSVSIRYVPGGKVRVRIEEDNVVAVQGAAGGWRGLTAAGDWIPMSEAAGTGEDAPVIEARGLEAGDEREAAGYLASVRARRPDLFAGFSQVSLAPGGEADVYWRDGRMKVRLDYRNKSLNSLDLLQELLRRERASWAENAVVDLRVEGYAYVL